MTDDRHDAVFAALGALREALRGVQTSDSDKALYQCDRLEQALRHWHAEAIRFAGYTINHIVGSPQSQLGGARDRLRERVDALRQALEASGHTF